MADLVQEVRGDYHLHVHKDMRTKIHGNEITEVITDRKAVINGQDDLFVAKNQTINIGDNKTITVGGNLKDTVKKNVDQMYGFGEAAGNHTINTKGNTMATTIGTLSITSKDNMKVSTDKDYNLNIKGNATIMVTGTQYESIGEWDNHDVGDYYRMNIETTWTAITGGAIDITGGGDITITANTDIKLNP